MPRARAIVAPSILSADFSRLGDEVRRAESGGADWIHIDVMDGRFVPNITMGPLVVKAVRSVTRLPLDVHLMIAEPERYVKDFVAAGADRVTVHVEATTHLQRTLAAIRESGAAPGAAVNPATPLSTVEHVLPDLSTLLVMTVNPGVGGQSFLTGMLPKVERARRMVDEAGLPTLVAIDGGATPETAAASRKSGADVVVAGSSVFSAKGDLKAAIEALRA
ncbi:MAG: ribulose-phosphate 3-epimerase [Methanobacteriota archaeon]